MVTLYNVISQDWFIARKNGAEDFIPDEHWLQTLMVIGKFKALVMGRTTYETIQNYSSKLTESLEKLPTRKIVVTNNKEYAAKNGYEVVHSPEDAIGLGTDTLVSSGPTLNNYLFRAKLVERVILHQVPVMVGDGIMVFDPVYKAHLKLETQRQLPLALELIYSVDRN